MTLVTNYEQVIEFHRAFNCPVASKPRLLPTGRSTLRVGLIMEELREYIEALENDDLVECADALADILYVTYGACVEHGFDADALFREVHRSNLTKLDPATGQPTLREDGKILKPSHFEPPEIAAVLEAQDAVASR